MNKLSSSAIFGIALLACVSTEGAANEDQAKRENFTVAGHNAFVILPPKAPADKPMRWVWYAPTLRGLPGNAEQWMFDRFHEAGSAVAGSTRHFGYPCRYMSYALKTFRNQVKCGSAN